MKNPSDWIFKRLKIDNEIINRIDIVYKTRGEQKADVIDEMIDWFASQRAEGKLKARYFVSAKNVSYVGLWLKPETIKKIDELAKADKQTSNRVIYTAIVRFYEMDLL